MMEPGRPVADECLPYYFQYIDLVPDGHIVELLERQFTETAAYLAAFTPEQASRRERPGEWNVLEIVGHLADVERVSAYRALHVARADPMKWTQVDFNGYAAAANFRDRPLKDIVAEYAAVRAATVALLHGLGRAAWERRAPADWTLRSVRVIAYNIAGHERHHLADIRRQHEG
jgi:DinB superfamily